MKLSLTSIRTDGGTQPRAEISVDMVQRYQEEMEGGATFPPPVVFHDGSNYWLADGFHRYRAVRATGAAKIDVEVRQGTQRDAVLFSVGANALHGLPRSNADKRRAVETLLRDEEWAKKSDRWIAEKCAVSARLVSDIRSTADSRSSPRTGKDGKTRRRSPPKPPKKMSEPLDAAPEVAAPAAPEPISVSPVAVVRPLPRLPAEEWTDAHAMRLVTAALHPVESLIGTWPKEMSAKILIDSLRGLADRLEGREEEISWQAN